MNDPAGFERTFILHTQAVTVTAASPRAATLRAFVCETLESRSEPSAEAPVDAPDLGDDATNAEELMRELTTRLVWSYADGLALHSAAIEVDGRAILFPAASGKGKSTLAVYLGAAGFPLLTDELLFVPLGSGQAHALARPAHLKPPSLFLLEAFPLLAASAHVKRYAHGALLSLLAFAPASARALKLGAIVIPDYAPTGAPALTRLTPGIASYSLLSALVNARNLPELGMPEVCRLCSAVPTFRMTYRTLEEALKGVKQIAHEPRQQRP